MKLLLLAGFGKGLFGIEVYMSSRIEASRQEKHVLTMLKGSDPHIALLRRAFAVWGLKYHRDR
jgi:hypothetical protein